MPEWVSEGSVRKYDRAVALLAKENSVRKSLGQAEVAVTEDAIKALYVKWGGLVIGDDASIQGNDHNSADDVMETAKEEVKRKRPAKK